MKRTWKRTASLAAIALAGVVVTLLLSRVPFFHELSLKAQDAHFVLRGKQQTQYITLIGIDEKTLDSLPELSSFWHPYYADAIRGAAAGGAKVFVLDHEFAVPVTKYEPDDDALLAQALAEASPKMPVITAFVASKADQKDAAFAVPFNMMSAAFGTAAYANLTVDPDDFVRRQELLEEPKAGESTEQLTRGMALRAAERFTSQEVKFRDGRLYLGDREIPTGDSRDVIINYAGPSDTFPRVSMVDFVRAVRAGNQRQLEQWVKGKIVLLGPDNNVEDRHDTPFFTAFALTNRWQMAGVEIHANVLRTLLGSQFLRPVPEWARIAALIITAGGTVAVVAAVAAAAQMTVAALVLLFAALIITHLLFLGGWLLSSADVGIAFAFSLAGGEVYRFATAEKKSSFFKSAVALFVGKDVAKSLDQSGRIGLTGQRRMVTILFSDIRGFTAFCESKDPAVIVDLLNVYMATMCSIIVKHHGHVNKFIGDGILAVFSDFDEGAAPGGHAARAVRCALEMVSAPGEFATGTGMHSGEVVIGNVGSSDKMEFTVLGDTVNLASRLESLNKEHKTKLLLSGTTHEMGGGVIDTVYLGAVPVRGKTEPMKLYTVASLMTEDIRKVHHLEEGVPA